MDRHDVSHQVTAEIVAQLHQQDLKIQDQFECRGMTYWFDEKRKAAFCLVEAPSKMAIKKMHQFAHGDVPNQIIEVQLEVVESFLGRIKDPEKVQGAGLNIINDSAFRTIMAIELKAFSHKHIDVTSSGSFPQRFTNTIYKKLKASNGSIVNRTENYFLASFQSVSKAVKASFEIDHAFNSLRAGYTGGRLSLKIGLAAGAPVTGRKLIFEDTIKTAERMCLAVHGRIIVSPEVRALYDIENPKPLTDNDNIVSITEKDEDFLTCLLDYIDSSWCDSNLKIDDLTRPLGYSKSQMYRKMIALTGKSPQAFIKEYRLREALTLLNRQQVNISEVAYQCGFTSPSYFSKCFRNMYGCSPSDIPPGSLQRRMTS
jgi:AraC-like DNA-binding protein